LSGRLKGYGIVWVTIALFILLTITTDPFLTEANLRNILDQQATLLIAASLATVAMIAGGFDISVSAVYVAVTAPGPPGGKRDRICAPCGSW
jgi:ribose transport system permease protein